MNSVFGMKKLNDVCIIRPPKKESLAFLNEDDLVSFVPMKNLEINQKYIQLNEEKELKKVYSGYTYFKDNDVLLAKITPCFENGKLGIAKNLKNGIGFGSSEYIVYRPKSFDVLNSVYLYYFLSQDKFREDGTPIMAGAVGHKRIPKEFYEEYLIPIPLIQEQKQIVEILDTAFEALEKAKTNLEKNLQNTKELFDSKLNEIFSQKGEGCEERKLEDLSDSKKAIVSGPFGSNLKVADYRDNGVPILRLQNVGKGKFIEKDIKYIEKEKAEELKSHSFVVGDIVLAKLGIPIGKTCIIPETFEDGIILADIVRIRPDKKIVNYKYLEYFLNTNLSVSQLTKEISGATRPRVNLSNVRNIVAPIPSLKVQNSIVEEINILENKTKQLEQKYQQKLDNLEELKKSLLQKAFSGELTK